MNADVDPQFRPCRLNNVHVGGGNLGPAASSRPPPETALARFGVRLMSATSVRRVCDDIREFARSYLYAILCLLSMLSLSLLVSVSLCVLGIPRAG